MHSKLKPKNLNSKFFIIKEEIENLILEKRKKMIRFMNYRIKYKVWKKN